VFAYLKRLATVGAAYQAGDLLSKGFAVVTLPLYTRYVAPAGYGAAQNLLVIVILASILLRLGLGEAFIRFYYDDNDQARRDRIAFVTVAFVALGTTVVALICTVFAAPLSNMLLGHRDATLTRIAVLGLWTFTNLEIAYALLRADERARTYMKASVADVCMTVPAMVWLVVVEHQGARGLLLGNFAASTVVLLGLWWGERRRVLAPLSRRLAGSSLRAMLRFGLPTVPADAGVYGLQVVDRVYLYRDYSQSAAGRYATAISLATVVFVAVRGFQYAWPPLAYSVTDDEEAARLYSLVTSYYVLATGIVVAGVALLGRWGIRLLGHRYYGAHSALPWLALGWSLYGLFLVFVVISGRARSTRRNVPAAFVGLVVNVAAVLLLVPPLGIAGAGIALCLAYAAMIVVLHQLTRSLFRVSFEWGRLARLVLVLGGLAVAGELLLPTHGLAGFLERGAVWCLILPLLALSGFFRAEEIARVRDLLARLRRRSAAA
jgi:O-antigen/teichoic acid export membrane protein